MNFPAIKVFDDAIEVEYEFSVTPAEEASSGHAAADWIRAGIKRSESELEAEQERVDALDRNIDRLSNNADQIDNLVAVSSGLLAGLIDAFWVGEFDFKRGKAWSNHTVNDFVMRVAKAQGFNGDRLKDAIKFLEAKFPVPTDNIWSGQDVGISARSHHLDDLAHHPTPVGLFFSILTQFTKTGYFQNGQGTFLPINLDEKGLELIGSDALSKIFCGTINWFFHLVSDMSGSNKTAGAGMGIPGPIVSLLKEISTIPGLNNSGLPSKIKRIFEKEKFDLRGEIAASYELGRQSLPVMVNEILVRAFYFIRRLVDEVKVKRSFEGVDWEKTLPWKNRTITRMLTISSGTFVAVDLADAAIRAGSKSVDMVTFGAQLLLRVNFVGLGRFSIAVYSDVSMGFQRERLRDERIAVLSEQLHWANAKAAFWQADAWQTAERTETCLRETEETMKQSMAIFVRASVANRASLSRIGQLRESVQDKNPGLIDDINDLLKWT
ncbi:hypothetical protein [Sphingobium xenophagum]|uniref:hypothetical protein n=1 Tax=Sphingobium xenophagum TaxID=121428 RepID=UPI0003749639|nr:hypothetical protein [Sphingobium xenophagum]